jgi:hypothetical protein
MHGSAATKLIRLVGSLTATPSNIPRYFACANKSSLELRLPWFSFGAIDFLDDWLRPDMTAYEYGSGGSTVFLASRVKTVVSIEDDPVWQDWVNSALTRTSKQSLIKVVTPIDYLCRNCPYVCALPTEPADIVIVDGVCRWPAANMVRRYCFERAERTVKPHGIIVLDDSWRYPNIMTSATAKERRRFQSVGPGRYGVTSTDIFFY